jgi:hypothetical protein
MGLHASQPHTGQVMTESKRALLCTRRKPPGCLVLDGSAVRSIPSPQPRRVGESSGSVAWTLLEEATGSLDVAGEERLDRLLDPYCGHAAALTAGVGICTVGALWCTLDVLFARGIWRIALWCALLHRTFRTSGAVGQRFESSVARRKNKRIVSCPICHQSPAVTHRRRIGTLGTHKSGQSRRTFSAISSPRERVSKPCTARDSQRSCGGGGK